MIIYLWLFPVKVVLEVYYGEKYTRWNRQVGQGAICARLDKVRVNENWLTLYSSAIDGYPDPNTSDHVPILLKVNQPRRKDMLKFINLWTNDESFMDLIRWSWSNPC